MQENYELVQRGFRILVSSMASYIGQVLHRKYKEDWWHRVCLMLNDQRDLPDCGSYGDLVDSLDVANCLRIITRMWRDDFSFMDGETDLRRYGSQGQQRTCALSPRSRPPKAIPTPPCPAAASRSTPGSRRPTPCSTTRWAPARAASTPRARP